MAKMFTLDQILAWRHTAIHYLQAHQYDDVWVFRDGDIILHADDFTMIQYGVCLDAGADGQDILKQYVSEGKFKKFVGHD